MNQKIRYTLISAAMAAFAWAIPAAAQQVALDEDQVHGEIVEVSSESELLRLRVEEAGDERAASPGEVIDYRVSSDTTIRMEDPFRSVVGAAGTNLTLADLEPGQRVTLNFEDLEGELVARNVSLSDELDEVDDRAATAGTTDEEFDTDTDQQSETEFAQLEEDRDTLPATASVLPMLGALGLGFGLIGLAIRWIRRR